MTTDAFATAIGAVFAQVQPDSSKRPVASAAKTLNLNERNYSVFERKECACLWAYERWNWYLYGRHFELRTNHDARTTLLSRKGKKQKPMRLLRWADQLSEYSFSVSYKPGAQNSRGLLVTRRSSKCFFATDSLRSQSTYYLCRRTTRSPIAERRR